MNLDWFLPVLKNQYADFSGRTNRKSFWMYILFVVLIGLVLSIVDSILGIGFVGLYLLFSIALLVPNIAIGARRLQDTGRSGWLMLIGLIPIIGIIVLIVFWVQEGQPEANQYGAVPADAAEGGFLK